MLMTGSVLKIVHCTNCRNSGRNSSCKNFDDMVISENTVEIKIEFLFCSLQLITTSTPGYYTVIALTLEYCITVLVTIPELRGTRLDIDLHCK